MNIKNEDGGKWPASPCMIGRILYKGLLVDKAMGSVGIQVVRSMMPEGTSMSNPYKWRAWAKIEATQQDGKKKFRWKPHACGGRPRLESIDGARKWMETVPTGAAVDYDFIKQRLKAKKKEWLLNRVNAKPRKSYSPSKNCVKIYMEEITMNPEEPLGITNKPYHKTEVRLVCLMRFI